MSDCNWKPETRRAYRARIKRIMRNCGEVGVYELERPAMWCLRPTASKPLLHNGRKP